MKMFGKFRLCKIAPISLVLFVVMACDITLPPIMPAGLTPTATSTSTQTLTPTPTITFTPSFTPIPTLTPTPTASPTPTPTPVPPEHVIGVRLVNGLGQFYNVQTGERFVPRGANYVRIDYAIADGQGRHSTFDPDLYDPVAIDQALGRMESDGYNTVRVFIDCCSIRGQQVGNRSGGLNLDYMQRVVDFLARAKTHHVYVILIVQATPTRGGYNTAMQKLQSSVIDDVNIRYLTAEGLQAKTKYMLDFIQTLINLRAPLDAILGYDLNNDVYFDSSAPPFTLTSGTVTVVNGRTYDMSSTADKQSMVNESLIYWFNQVRTSVRSLDPTALVTISPLLPQAPVPARAGDSHYVLTKAFITLSDADFIDAHAYPGWGLSLEDYARNYGISARTRKPVIMGEFGAIRSVYPYAPKAASALQSWQIESCQYGFDGWLTWTWDTSDQGFWTARGNNDVIEKALSPVFRPDPCRTE